MQHVTAMSATIIDSNVLIDLIEPGARWVSWSRKRFAAAVDLGPTIINIVIAAEVSYGFVDRAKMAAFFRSAPWMFEDIPEQAAPQAGWAHRSYRMRGGTRDRTLPDFLIGAHAAVRGYALLTRDPSGFRTYFPDLDIIAPDTHP